ncbi:MAG: amidohydrolase family protein [Balneolaceae bacterium]|nr:amidohydrolase family protein [Balneolaceae bacterium]
MSYSEKQQAFINKANDTISDDPSTRLGPVAKRIVDRNEFVIDAHCHIFDGDCVKVTYLVARFLISFSEFLPPRIYWAVKKIFRRIFGLISFDVKSTELFINDLLPGQKSSFNQLSDMDFQNEIDQSIDDFIDEINSFSVKSDTHIDVDNFLNEFEREIDELEKQLETSVELYSGAHKVAILGFDRRGFFRRLRHIISLLRSKTMKTVLNRFEDEYAINRVYNKEFGANNEQLSIVLGMDLNSGWDGSSEKSYTQQNNELGALSQTEGILPYLPIDPRRAEKDGEENLYEAFLKAFNKDNPTYFGVKCYPALGYLPSDARLTPIFEICEKKNIPIITHCGGEMISTFDNPVVVYRGNAREEIDDQKRKHRARKLNEPIEWKPVLEQFNDLRLCLGHFGGKGAWNGKPATKDRIPTILQMMADYPNLYADFSFNLESDKTVSAFTKKLFADDTDSKLMSKRTLFGTDFWVVLPMSDLNNDQRSFLKAVKGYEKQLLTTNVRNYLGI